MPEEVPARVVAALREQDRRRRLELAAGATRVGWKIGRGLVEGEENLEPVIGYLTSATAVEPGSEFDAAGTTQLRVDAEVVVEVGRDGGATRFGAALELVDVVRPPDDFETILAENIWHRGVAFSRLSAEAPPEAFLARVLVDGEVAGATEGRVDVEETMAIASRLLAVLGERLELGDRIIAGSILHIPVRTGNHVTVDLGELGRVDAQIR